jgi:hypothetical protein
MGYSRRLQLLFLFVLLFAGLIVLLKSLPPGSRLKFLSNITASLCLLVLGLPILLSASIQQKNHGGPPIVGPIAEIIGIALVLIGTYCTIRDYRAYKKSLQ